MSNQKVVAKIRDFLITELQTSLIYKQAECDLESIRHTTANKKKITKEDVDEHIQKNYLSLKQKVEKDLEETAKQLVAENSFCGVLKDIGVLSLILIPPMYPLIRYLIILLDCDSKDIVEVSACFVALFLLSVPIVGYFASLFRK